MKTPDPLSALRFQVRALWGAVLVSGCVAAANSGNVHPVHLSDADNTPDTTVSLSGPRWTGTLDAARLPADPVAGLDVTPASVNADGGVQAGGYLATRSGNFFADDFGVYLYGNQFADPNGNLTAYTAVTTPTVYVGTICLSDGSQLSAGGGRLVWTDPQGNAHNVTTDP